MRTGLTDFDPTSEFDAVAFEQARARHKAREKPKAKAEMVAEAARCLTWARDAGQRLYWQGRLDGLTAESGE